MPVTRKKKTSREKTWSSDARAALGTSTDIDIDMGTRRIIGAIAGREASYGLPTGHRRGLEFGLRCKHQLHPLQQGRVIECTIILHNLPNLRDAHVLGARD